MTATHHANDTGEKAAATVTAAGGGVFHAATGVLTGTVGVLSTAAAAVAGVAGTAVADTGKVLNGVAATATSAGQTVVGAGKTAAAAVTGSPRSSGTPATTATTTPEVWREPETEAGVASPLDVTQGLPPPAAGTHGASAAPTFGAESGAKTPLATADAFGAAGVRGGKVVEAPVPSRVYGSEGL